MVTGTKVVTENGNKITYKDTFIRSLSRLVSFEALSIFLVPECGMTDGPKPRWLRQTKSTVLANSFYLIQSKTPAHRTGVLTIIKNYLFTPESSGHYSLPAN